VDLSKIKLIATDMDGTLLNSKHELNPEFYSIFEKLKKKNIVFAAASGRQYHNIRNVFSAIEREMFFIAENGGYVVHQEEDILVQEMERQLTHELIQQAKSVEGTFTILCGRKRAYIDDETPFFVEHLERYYDEYAVVKSLLDVEDDQFLKIAICDISGAEGNTFKLFRERGADLQIKVSGNIWLDISHKQANKGRALHVLQERLNILPEETMVFGDYLNDVEMMQQAYFSFAMENAHPEVKAVSRFRAKSNDDNGVIEVLRTLTK
jgi:Cof subfamily protein (haloacid dehalogenase superfamily)